MYCKTKLVALVLFTGLFFVGCDKDKDSGSGLEITDIDLAKVLEYPYSALNPEEQKVKLENESMAFLDFGNALKTSGAIEALQNLGRLLDEDSPEIVEGKEVKSVKETVEYADVYGIFTWDNKEKVWKKTASNSELKFVFPAKKSATSNNAVFSVKAVSSGISVTQPYEEYEGNGKYTEYETTYYLPKSTTGILTIDNNEAAKVELTAEYKDNKQVPVKSEYKITTNDGYVFMGELDKATENKVAMKLTYKDNVMFEAMGKSGIKVDQILDLLEDDADINYSLYNKANAYMKLMDNLVLVYEIDIENYVKESQAIKDDYNAKWDALYSDWEAYEKNRNRYTAIQQYEKEESDKLAEVLNKYMTIVLASTTDGSKIADVIVKSEVDGPYTDPYYWDSKTGSWQDDYRIFTKKYDYYHHNQYLKFKDNTLVEMSTYFSEGFNKIETKWEDFVKAFNR